jgi:hypothetical protein
MRLALSRKFDNQRRDDLRKQRQLERREPGRVQRGFHPETVSLEDVEREDDADLPDEAPPGWARSER